MGEKPRVGVSACLVGEPVRFNGGHCRDGGFLPELSPFVEFAPLCPEVGAGLGAPRESMRLTGPPSAPRLVGGRSGRDETLRLTLWSRGRMADLEGLDLCGFVLKKGSPSCGMERVRVYRRPDTRPSNEGIGVFARELMARFPLLAVEEEGRLQDPGLREHFVTRVFATDRWRRFLAGSPARGDLVAFHGRHVLLLRAHDASAEGRLAAMVDDGVPTREALVRYGKAFLATLRTRPTRRSQGAVLAEILDTIPRPSLGERRELEEVLREYDDGLVPLVVPARLLLHHVRRTNHPWRSQVWFAPWPRGLRLRTRITHEPTAARARAGQEVNGEKE